MHTADIEYGYGDLRLVGELAVDDSRSGPRPAVLVCHDAIGLGEHAKGWAHRLAEHGYLAFALDYYGGGRALPSAELGPRYTELTRDPLLFRALGRAGLDVLLNHEYARPDQVAVIGFCLGGTLALELARSGADVHAVVGFHCGLATSRPKDAANITSRILLCLGTEDPYAPAEDRLAFEREMRDAGIAWDMHLYGGVGHSFTNPATDGMLPGIRYDRRADERSWHAMINLFDEVFAEPTEPTGAGRP
jgi:dienelactone hydrolase